MRTCNYERLRVKVQVLWPCTLVTTTVFIEVHWSGGINVQVHWPGEIVAKTVSNLAHWPIGLVTMSALV